MSSYLVTGGAGFIGSAIVRRLIQEGKNVVTLDNLSTGKISNIPEKCEFIEGNIYDKNVIKKLNNWVFDTIIHIAGQSSGETSFEDPVYDLQTNTQSTIMLLDYATKTGCKHFIYASTMSVYGDQDNPYVDEESILSPKSFYAIGKMASEYYLKIYSSLGMKCTALRLFNVYGIGQNMSNMKQGMLSIYLAMAIKNKQIIVKGSKDRYRDFININDVVEAFVKSLKRTKGDPFEVYNISSGEKYTVENVINKINDFLPYEIIVKYGEGTPGDQFGIYGNSDKAYLDLKWKASIPFDAGFKEMIDWATLKLKEIN